MHKQRARSLPLWLCVMLSSALMIIGMVLLIAPEAGEIAFGTRISEGGNYSFHRATGIREAYVGVIILILV